MWPELLLFVWGCMPELTRDCQDMTNASSTYLGIAAGAVIGGIISWWIYNRQRETSKKQDLALDHVRELNERHDKILKRLEESDKRHDSTLDAILELDKKIDNILENQNILRKSFHFSGSSQIDDYTPTGASDSKENNNEI